MMRVVVFKNVVLEGKNCDCPEDEAMAKRSGGSDMSDIGLVMWPLVTCNLGCFMRMDLQGQGNDGAVVIGLKGEQIVEMVNFIISEKKICPSTLLSKRWK